MDRDPYEPPEMRKPVRQARAPVRRVGLEFTFTIIIMIIILSMIVGLLLPAVW